MAMVNGFKGDGSDNDRIRDWLCNPENAFCCHECPYEMEHPSHDALPCGQYHCWVELTCRRQHCEEDA